MSGAWELTPRTFAAAGAVTAVLLGRICEAAGRPLARTGAEASLLFSLERPEAGESFVRVQAWLDRSATRFAELGIRVGYRWGVHRPDAAGSWVEAGKGRRGLLLAVDGTVLHPTRRLRADTPHAVGIGLGHRNKTMLLDAFCDPPERAFADMPDNLDLAAGRAKYNGLELFWIGWS